MFLEDTTSKCWYKMQLRNGFSIRHRYHSQKQKLQVLLSVSFWLHQTCSAITLDRKKIREDFSDPITTTMKKTYFIPKARAMLVKFQTWNMWAANNAKIVLLRFDPMGTGYSTGHLLNPKHSKRCARHFIIITHHKDSDLFIISTKGHVSSSEEKKNTH